MFEEKLNWVMRTKGLDADNFNSLLRDEEFLSDNKLFAISRFINAYKPPIFLTKKIGKLDIICRRFDIAVTYTITTKEPCRVVVDFHTLDLEVEYSDCKLIIDQNLSDYRGEHTIVNDLRQTFLNEILIRYFTKILYSMYKELRWFS